MKQFAIYTACIGNYDQIRQPVVIDNRFDYILFTNDVKDNRIGVWQVRSVDYANDDMTRIARYAKTHPEKLLSEYDATLWMDMNLQIADSYVYERFIELYESKVEIASIQHPERDCIFTEAFTMSNWRFEHDCIAFEWCHKLRNDGYPRHRGMYETNILYRRKSEVMTNVNKMWWDCIDNYSKRDQFSCNYVLWKLGVKEEYFFTPGEHSMNSMHINYAVHSKVSKRKLVNVGFNELLRIKTRNLLPNVTLRQWHVLCNLPYPNIVLNTWGYVMGILCTPILAFKMFKHRILHIPG